MGINVTVFMNSCNDKYKQDMALDEDWAPYKKLFE